MQQNQSTKVRWIFPRKYLINKSKSFWSFNWTSKVVLNMFFFEWIKLIRIIYFRTKLCVYSRTRLRFSIPFNTGIFSYTLNIALKTKAKNVMFNTRMVIMRSHLVREKFWVLKGKKPSLILTFVHSTVWD